MRETHFRIPVYKPFWVYVLIGVLIAVFIAEEFTGGSTSLQNLIRLGANVGILVDQGEYWRLITAIFLHIGLIHLAIDIYSIYMIGRENEALFGWKRFLPIFFFSGLTGSVFGYFFRHQTSAGPASGVFGLLGALTIFYYRYRGFFGTVSQKAMRNISITMLINIGIAFIPGVNIDVVGNLGGLLAGIFLGWFFCPKYRQVESGRNEVLPNTNIPVVYLADENTWQERSISITLLLFVLITMTISRANM